MSATESLAFNDTSVRDTMHAFDAQYASSLTNMNSLRDQIQDVAVAIQQSGDAEMAERLREPMADLLRQRQELQGLRTAMASLRGAYQPSQDLQQTDFDAQIASRTPAASCEPEQEPAYLELHAVLSGQDPAAGGGQGGGGADGDDECMIEPERGQLAPNSKCPLSQKNLVDLADPVADAKGYVYEKEFVEAYVKTETRRRGLCKCPVAGTSHNIALSDLKRATAVVREQRKRELRAATNPGGGSAGQREDDDAIDL